MAEAQAKAAKMAVAPYSSFIETGQDVPDAAKHSIETETAKLRSPGLRAVPFA